MKVKLMFRAFAVTVFLALNAEVASAAANCHVYLAKMASFALSLKTKTTNTNNTDCQLADLELQLLITGAKPVKITLGNQWAPYPTVYTATVVLTPAPSPSDLGTQTLTLGSDTRTLVAKFDTTPGPILASYEVDAADAKPAYIVNQLTLSMTSGPNSLFLNPNAGQPLPPALVELAGGTAPWPASFAPDSSSLNPTTVTVTFRLDPPPSGVTAYQPYVNEVGEAIKWSGKITGADLPATLSTEQTWMQSHVPPQPFAGRYDFSSPYYHKIFDAGRWWLVAPSGRLGFYFGVTSVSPYSTPITNRPQFFQFPNGAQDTAGNRFLTAYSHPYKTDPTVTEFSYVAANQIRKYCGADESHCTSPFPGCTNPCKTLAAVADYMTAQRLASWGFSGEGKFFGQDPLQSLTPLPRPALPVLRHDDVPNLVSHPDPFDLSTQTQLHASLKSQMLNHITDVNVIGWSVGNENAEIIGGEEILAILNMGASVAAKRALASHAAIEIYGGNWGALDAAWGVSATNPLQLWNAVPQHVPSSDVTTLRKYYEDTYYALLHDTVKGIDGDHLYFGSWILSGDPTLPEDWPIAAAHSDVVGFDDFNPGPLSETLTGLFALTNKPVLMGAWGVPSDYAGARGFGWKQYTNALTLSDAASGAAYSAKLMSASADKYVVGAALFDYYDEPLTGRGGTGATGDASGDLVIGEDFAFGLLDTTDSPKYDLVNQVRAANCAVLASLGLATCQ